MAQSLFTWNPNGHATMPPGHTYGTTSASSAASTYAEPAPSLTMEHAMEATPGTLASPVGHVSPVGYASAASPVGYASAASPVGQLTGQPMAQPFGQFGQFGQGSLRGLYSRRNRRSRRSRRKVITRRSRRSRRSRRRH